MAYNRPGQVTAGNAIAESWGDAVDDSFVFFKNLVQAVAVIQDQKAGNTAGGTFTAGAWRTRDLNAEVSDGQALVAISSNQFTPAAADYLLLAWAPAFIVQRHQARLYNATGTAAVITGSSEVSNAADSTQTLSFVCGAFTANGSDAYEIQHYCSTTNADDGYGLAANTGVGEVYTTVLLIKLDD